MHIYWIPTLLHLLKHQWRHITRMNLYSNGPVGYYVVCKRCEHVLIRLSETEHK